MIACRPYTQADIPQLKQLWKLAFGDEDSYIDFFYATRLPSLDCTVLALDGAAVSMITSIPTQIVLPNGQKHPSSMLYAIATHPQHQGQGYAGKLISFTHKMHQQKGIHTCMLVPASTGLFAFYAKQGYKDAFYLRQATLSHSLIMEFAICGACDCQLAPATPAQYSALRAQCLAETAHVAYTEGEISYQKRASQLSGADLYHLQLGDVAGCAAVERLSPETVLIKEILFPNDLIHEGIQKIAKLLPATEYVVRMPAAYGQHFGGVVRPFGVICQSQQATVHITANDQAFLGLAFD